MVPARGVTPTPDRRKSAEILDYLPPKQRVLHVNPLILLDITPAPGRLANVRLTLVAFVVVWRGLLQLIHGICGLADGLVEIQGVDIQGVDIDHSRIASYSPR